MQRSGAPCAWNFEQYAKEMCRNNNQRDAVDVRMIQEISMNRSGEVYNCRNTMNDGNRCCYNERQPSDTMVRMGTELSKRAAKMHSEGAEHVLTVTFMEGPRACRPRGHEQGLLRQPRRHRGYDKTSDERDRVGSSGSSVVASTVGVCGISTALSAPN